MEEAIKPEKTTLSYVNLRAVLRVCTVAATLTAQTTYSAGVTTAITSHETAVLATSQGKARQWGLSEEDWLRYQKVLVSRRGIWSPGIDPLSALGVTAQSVSERRRFAELYVRAEFERVRKELAFQVEVDAAWKRLYPNTPRLLGAARAKPDTRVTQRYAVVVSEDCMDCARVVQRHLDIQASMETQEPLDVHVVGTQGNDARLRAWAEQNRWLEAALKSGQATLNHGADFADLSQFPVVYAKKEGGQWEREL